MVSLRSELNFKQFDDFDLSFKVFYDLMAKRVKEILLISSSYDAFIMEEDGRIPERIIHEFRCLNLTRPPRIIWASSAQKALKSLNEKKIDLVITMPRIDDMNTYDLGSAIKKKYPEIPVVLLSHAIDNALSETKLSDKNCIDKTFIWLGNTDLLLAIIKSIEDQVNVDFDTQRAGVRVIIFVEDSPLYLSSLLPFLYKEIVMQTQAVMEELLNEEHRIFRMRARPKILVAETYEEAMFLYEKYKKYLLCIFSDVRFPKNGKMDDRAGFSLVSGINKDSPDLPVLMFSSEETNRLYASSLSSCRPFAFLNKNSPSFHKDIRHFFVDHLGFGDFIFRLPGGKEIARASNFKEIEKVLTDVCDESLYYHAYRNDFSSWLIARSEIQLASKLRLFKATEFTSITEIRELLLELFRQKRKRRHQGVITDFMSDNFDPDTDFVKIGKGSLGGKARGLAFMSTILKSNKGFKQSFPDINICIPKTVVITTEGFDSFINENNLTYLLDDHIKSADFSDDNICYLFLLSSMPDWLSNKLELFLKHVKHPLAIRSSSLLEDAYNQPCAGIYSTYMLSNNHPDFSVRVKQLEDAIKLVYASRYMQKPRAFSENITHTTEEKMAVILQQLIGTNCNNFFYPAISGVAQSYNFYPISFMKPTEGVLHLAAGLGKIVVEGGKALRLSPKYPKYLPQFSSVDDILKNSQRFFYAVKMGDLSEKFISSKNLNDDPTIATLVIDDVISDPEHLPIQLLSSTYMPEDHMIKDLVQKAGYPVITFANILKYNMFPLCEIVSMILDVGRKGMGGHVEIEFAANLTNEKKQIFSLLQMRPMATCRQNLKVAVNKDDISSAYLYSNKALGVSKTHFVCDIVFVMPDAFDPACTVEIAAQIDKLNRLLVNLKRKYILIGSGRWGSADRWLGIPVTWNNISNVLAIVETSTDKLHADPSQGTHFFHNITSLGISYITISQDSNDFINYDFLMSLPVENQTTFLRHAKALKPLILKIDGNQSKAVLI